MENQDQQNSASPLNTLLTIIGTLITLGAPAAYLLAYFYEAGQSSVWGVPSMFVDADPRNLLRLATLFVLLLSLLSVPVYFIAGAVASGVSANALRLLGLISTASVLGFDVIQTSLSYVLASATRNWMGVWFDLAMLAIYALVFYLLPPVFGPAADWVRQHPSLNRLSSPDSKLRRATEVITEYIDANIDFESERQWSNRVVRSAAALVGVGMTLVLVFNFGAWQQRQKTQFLVPTERPSRVVVWVDEDKALLLPYEDGMATGVPYLHRPTRQLWTDALSERGIVFSVFAAVLRN